MMALRPLAMPASCRMHGANGPIARTSRLNRKRWISKQFFFVRFLLRMHEHPTLGSIRPDRQRTEKDMPQHTLSQRPLAERARAFLDRLPLEREGGKQLRRKRP